MSQITVTRYLGEVVLLLGPSSTMEMFWISAANMGTLVRFSTQNVPSATEGLNFNFTKCKLEWPYVARDCCIGRSSSLMCRLIQVD